jgi:hypothetical protein
MNKLLITSMSLSLVVLFTSNNNFTNANALITAPTNYDISYRQSNVDQVSGNSWAIIGNNFSILPIYTGTYDGQYYYYTNTTEVIDGLTITQTFNRSNTSWTTITGGSPFTARPSNSTAFIGSNNQVGTNVVKKQYYLFDNQTSKEYRIYFDLSSTGAGDRYYQLFLNNVRFNAGFSASLYYNFTVSYHLTMLIPAYSTFEFFTHDQSTQSFIDAWYLEDLGVSSSYIEGYDNGYDTGYSLGDSQGYLDGFEFGYESGFEDGFNELNNTASGLFQILGSAFTAIGSIFNIMILPGITIGMLVFVPIIFALLLFIIKILRGGS